uniref:Uncharacterized protein n=1 Tax=Rhizochromulina marina TaxID=1034831 RepID=A0A7S2WFB6_9STRA
MDSEASAGSKTAVFNGDFNFFNWPEEEFEALNRGVMRYVATAGNVEVESVDPDSDGSCGCAYPSYVPDAVVDRSNAIVGRLRQTAQAADPDIQAWLAALPRFQSFRIENQRVTVIHGDPESLAGWKFSVEAMEPVDNDLRSHFGCASDLGSSTTSASQVADFFHGAATDVFACTHTCLPFAQVFPGAAGFTLGGDGVVVNNGSAGMPNFRGSSHGLITRIASASLGVPEDSAYGITVGDLRIDAIPVHYDHEAWVARFLRNWPQGSPAHESYFTRIASGVSFFHVHQADRLKA